MGINFYSPDIDEKTSENEYYRNVLYTCDTSQVSLQSLNVGEDVPWELHHKTTQWIKIISGSGSLKVYDRLYKENRIFPLKAEVLVEVPPETFHYILNNGRRALKFYTIYTHPVHKKDEIVMRQNSAYMVDREQQRAVVKDKKNKWRFFSFKTKLAECSCEFETLDKLYDENFQIRCPNCEE